MYVFPYITKRIFSCNLEIFSELLKKGSIKLEDIEAFSNEGKQLVSEIKNTYTGCIVLVMTKKYLSPSDFQDKKLVEDNYIEVMCCYLSKMALACQISKEFMHMFGLKYNVKIKSIEAELVSTQNEKAKEVNDLENEENDNEVDIDDFGDAN
jgi:hypothetical protein